MFVSVLKQMRVKGGEMKKNGINVTNALHNGSKNLVDGVQVWQIRKDAGI